MLSSPPVSAPSSDERVSEWTTTVREHIAPAAKVRGRTVELSVTVVEIERHDFVSASTVGPVARMLTPG